MHYLQDIDYLKNEKKHFFHFVASLSVSLNGNALASSMLNEINKRCIVRTQFGNFNLILTKVCEFKHYYHTNNLRCRSVICKL